MAIKITNPIHTAKRARKHFAEFIARATDARAVIKN